MPAHHHLLWPLDLKYFGTHIGQEHRGVRPSNGGGQVENPDVRKQIESVARHDSRQALERRLPET
jgi:hypothetical protein